MLEWVRLKYAELAGMKQYNFGEFGKEQVPGCLNLEAVNNIFLSISSILKILNAYNLNELVSLEITRLSLLEHIK